MTSLRGMTWSHPRGYDPLVACSALWKERTGADVAWDRRSLQDFESYPVEELASRYDLIVIDHPHVGRITAEKCLLPLDIPGREAAGGELARGSVGPSCDSYLWNGRRWALPIDAAAQVQAWRPDRIAAPARTWSEVLELAARGLVACPLRPPHALMVFYTLAANLGHPCAVAGADDLVEPQVGEAVYAMMQDLVARIDPACFAMDPIAAFEQMAQVDSAVACVPLAYGYVSYARDGFRPARLAFCDMPAAGSRGPVGSTLGGTGIAVSARTAHPAAAIDFAYWLAGADVQCGPYAASGGQPGHAAAWEDPAVNAPTHDFYKATRASLDGSWMRPRHDGYMAFQDAASQRINHALASGETGAALIADLNRGFRDSFRR
jgi:multiple sugar transport system substrate-binding protein